MANPIFEKKNSSGPLQIVHDFRFTALNVKDDYSFLDTASHEEKLKHQKERVKKLADTGYGGIVLNVDHINYLKDKKSFERVKEVSLYAKSLGLKVWLYDEQYYPSGGAGGKTLEGHSEFESAALSMVCKEITVEKDDGPIRVPSPLGHSSLKFATIVPVKNGVECFDERIDASSSTDIAGGLCFDAPIGDWKVYCFFVRAIYEGAKHCQGTRASRRYINIRDKKAVKRFYDVTFSEGYNTMFPSLSDAVEAVFTDEPYASIYFPWKDLNGKTAFESFSLYDKPNNEIPIYPYVPWHDDVPDIITEKYNVDFKEIVLDIFVNTQSTRNARTMFYTILSDMALEAFPKQLQDKLWADGVNLSGHYYGEEGFDVQPFYYGDIIDHLSVMGIPGCDKLQSAAFEIRHSIAGKLASSAAHLAGKDGVMIEASNMSDKNQNITLDELKGTMAMMFALGINTITSYYGENLLPNDQMKDFASYISNLTSLFDTGRFYTDTFLYYPFEELCANCEPEGIALRDFKALDRLGIEKTAKSLFEKQISFDIINKRFLAECEICNGFIKTKTGNKIRTIVMPDITYVDDELKSILTKAKENGVKVIFNCKQKDIENLPFSPDFGIDSIKPGDVCIHQPQNLVTYIHKCFDDYDLYMFVNTDDKPCSFDVSINCSDESKFCLVNADTLETSEIQYIISDNQANIHMDINSLTPIILCKF